MIQKLTKLRVIDNTGVVSVKCIGLLKKKKASIGDIIVVSVCKRFGFSKLQKGSIIKAVVTHTKKKTRREDGTFINFSENTVVLINEKKEPLGTNIPNFLPFEIKKKGFVKIFSLSKYYI